MSESSAPFSRASRVASSILFGESLVVLALGLYMISLGFTHDKSWMPYLSVTGFAFAGSAALYALSRGVQGGKRWANSPAILANLIALGVAKYQLEAGLFWLGIPVAVMAVTVIATLFVNIKNSQI